MKIALITDTHFGIRGDSTYFLDNTKMFLDNVFFPTLKEQGINTIVHLGDLVDRRKYINFNTAKRLREDFIDPLFQTNDLQFHWLLGNHDIFHRNQTDINASQELFRDYSVLESENFIVYEKAQEVNLHEFGSDENLKVLFVPWICDSNREQTEYLINNTDATVCFGHLELEGFEMFKGVIQKHGEPPDKYKKFDFVASGHYHHRSSHNNIHYLGSHSEFTWSDCGDPRGFHTFDTSTLELQFIPNPYTIFEKVFYDDGGENKQNGIDASLLKNKIVKLIVRSRTDSDQYNTFLAQCEAAQPIELLVVEDHLNFDKLNDDTLVSETKSTLDIIREYIASANNIVDSSKLDDLIVELYREAEVAE